MAALSLAIGLAFALPANATLAQQNETLASKRIFWTGLGADNKFSTNENWLRGRAPVSGDTIVFTAQPFACSVTTVSLNNDLPFAFASIEWGRFDAAQMPVMCVPESFAVDVYINKLTLADAATSLSFHRPFSDYITTVIVNKLKLQGSLTVDGVSSTRRTMATNLRSQSRIWFLKTARPSIA